MLSSWEPPIGIEPMTYALRVARSRAAYALAAPIARVMAPVALAALGLSGEPVHEPVHVREPASLHPATVCKRCPRHGSAPRKRTGCRVRRLTCMRYAHSPVNQRPDLPK